MIELYTIPEIIDEAFGSGMAPPERTLIVKARRLGLGRKLGRRFYLTEEEAECLLSANEDAIGSPGAPSRPVKRTAGSPGSELRKALELSQKLEQGKSPQTSNVITTTSRIIPYLNVHPASLKQP